MEKKLGYNFLDYNPSEETPLPVISDRLFQDNGDLAWLGDYDKYSYLIDVEYSNLEQLYPNLMMQLELMSPYFAGSDDIWYARESRCSYKLGSVIGLLSVDNSLPEGHAIIDVTGQYVRSFNDLDGIEMDYWRDMSLRYMKYHYNSMKQFIMNAYCGTIDNRQLDIILNSSCNAYMISSHSLACLEREKELAWMTRDDESFQGWLTYRYGRD